MKKILGTVKALRKEVESLRSTFNEQNEEISTFNEMLLQLEPSMNTMQFVAPKDRYKTSK